jgi:hypothetical protein
MNDEHENAGRPAATADGTATGSPGMPAVVGRAAFQAPIGRWPRLGAGCSDDLGTASR